jgi:GNAT superfamily N-acetyltransferase
MDAATEALVGHLNLGEFVRENARWQTPSEIVEDNGLMLAAGARPWPVPQNQAFRADRSVPGTEVVERATAFFHERGRGWCVYVRDRGTDDDIVAAVKSIGAMQLFDMPQLVCRTRLDDRPAPDGVELRWVTGESGMRDYAAVNGAAYVIYGSPAEETASNFGRADRFCAPHVQSVVAYIDDAPVGAAQIILSHGIAGVFWVGVVEAARGRGVGENVARAVTNRGFDFGAANVQLQASPMGNPIYRRMGYAELYNYSCWLAPGPG